MGADFDKLKLDALLEDKVKNLRQIKAHLRLGLKKGCNLSGYYSLIQSLGPVFRKEYGRWARRRGRRFQNEVVQLLSKYFEEGGDSCWAYRAANERCATQLYDVVIYLKNKPPIFIECKVGGLKNTSRGYTIDYNCRSMLNIEERREFLKQLDNKLSAIYFFAYPGRNETELRLVTLKDVLYKSKKPTVYQINSGESLRSAYEACID